jgi:TRAP transporter TAXI family solute receptor
MKKMVVISVVGMLVLGLAALAPAQQAVKMVMATGGTAGTYYPFGGAIAKIWNEKIPGMNVTVQTTGGSVENVRLTNKKEAELAIAQSDTLDFAYNAKESFKEKLINVRAIAVLFPEIMQLVVRADSPIKSFMDLKGQKISVGAPGSGTEACFRTLMGIHGLKKEDIRAQYLSFAEGVEQFKDRHIDAIVVLAGIPTAAVMDVSVQREIRILPIADDMIAKVVQVNPFLTPAKLPANTYKGLTSEVRTIAVMAAMVVNSEIKEDIVYNLTKVLFENQSTLAMSHVKGKELNIQTAVKGVSIPFHPGAVKFYKEKGAM